MAWVERGRGGVVEVVGDPTTQPWWPVLRAWLPADAPLRISQASDELAESMGTKPWPPVALTSLPRTGQLPEGSSPKPDADLDEVLNWLAAREPHLLVVDRAAIPAHPALAIAYAAIAGSGVRVVWHVGGSGLDWQAWLPALNHIGRRQLPLNLIFEELPPEPIPGWWIATPAGLTASAGALIYHLQHEWPAIIVPGPLADSFVDSGAEPWQPGALLTLRGGSGVTVCLPADAGKFPGAVACPTSVQPAPAEHGARFSGSPAWAAALGYADSASQRGMVTDRVGHGQAPPIGETADMSTAALTEKSAPLSNHETTVIECSHTTSPQVVAALVRQHGYCIVRGALSQAELAVIRPRFDQLMASEVVGATDARHIEIRRLLERDPCLADLMVQPTVFPMARALIGRDITLASAGEGDCRPAHTGAYISWHNDFVWMPDLAYPRQNAWIRCTYLLNDVTAERGPFTLLPGTHTENRPCPAAEMTDDQGQPRIMPSQVAITGRAGDCLINNTEIWHTATPNKSDQPRLLAMLLYKHAWMRQWEEGYELSKEFVAAQTDPVRQQLCNVGVWHRTDGKWPADVFGQIS